MRTYRVFNGIDRVEVEWNRLGLRWQVPTSSALGAAFLLGALLAQLGAAWLGFITWALMSMATIYLNVQINRLDRAGLFRESTQVAMMWRTLHAPIIGNGGALTVDAHPIVTNNRKLI